MKTVKKKWIFLINENERNTLMLSFGFVNDMYVTIVSLFFFRGQTVIMQINCTDH